MKNIKTDFALKAKCTSQIPNILATFKVYDPIYTITYHNVTVPTNRVFYTIREKYEKYEKYKV